MTEYASPTPLAYFGEPHAAVQRQFELALATAAESISIHIAQSRHGHTLVAFDAPFLDETPLVHGF